MKMVAVATSWGRTHKLRGEKRGWFWFVEDRSDNGGQAYMVVMS
jgi:hypothetical protein